MHTTIEDVSLQPALTRPTQGGRHVSGYPC